MRDALLNGRYAYLSTRARHQHHQLILLLMITRLWKLGVPSDHAWKAVGIIKLPTARARRLEAVWATTGLKCCSSRLIPPRKKHIPKTNRRFESILPMREVCTMTTSSATSAMIATINSTAFLDCQNWRILSPESAYPKVAFNRPPMVSPVLRLLARALGKRKIPTA